MTIYVIDEDLGPTYWLRLPREDESLEGKRTVELSDDDFADYERASAAYEGWQARLAKKRGSA